MGYDSKLYVGEASSHSSKEGTWVDVVATIDLCVMGYRGEFSRLLAASKAERTDNRRFYWHEGEEGYVHEDLYGDALLPLNLDDTIKAIEADDTDGYRRLPPALALLRSFQEHPEQWRDLVVLHFGH